MTKVACIGECMIELKRAGQGTEAGLFSRGYGGDTLNTAVYLARLGVTVDYVTALGDDPLSDEMIDGWAAEGVGTSRVVRLRGKLPGLYLIETDDKGERKFFYWRDTSPARELFELDNWAILAEALLSAKLVYFSGITLSLYSNTGIGRFLAALELARKQGVTVAFDGNFRPRGWKGDMGRARTVFTEALKRVDIALPTFEDEATLWGDANPEATVARLQAFGIGEIAVKNGQENALVADKSGREFVPVTEVVEPVDTTAAGDSFNAAYLAARLKGEGPVAAARAAHALAAQVIRHRGAIMPRAAGAMH
jgi:2-dehydro-3-deoxygluconokinase